MELKKGKNGTEGGIFWTSRWEKMSLLLGIFWTGRRDFLDEHRGVFGQLDRNFGHQDGSFEKSSIVKLDRNWISPLEFRSEY